MSDTPITDALLESLQLGYQHKENALIDHARQLERELAHWQRMYECAQNANALRAKALDAVDLSDPGDAVEAWYRAAYPYATPEALGEALLSLRSKLALAAEYEAGTEELIKDLSGLLRECLELSDNWPGVAYSSELLLRTKAALLRAKP